jgi:nitrogen regulatory protein PII-like uncharacterized protein
MELTKEYFDKKFGELDNKFATKEYFDKKFGELDEKFATKEYIDGKLTNFAIKDDFKNFATKDDLKNFATKDDLKNFATKDDFKNFATKDDLKAQTKELKDYADQQTEHLASIIATTVANPLQRHLEEVSVAEEVSMAIWKKIEAKSRKSK